MKLKEFLRGANRRERADVAVVCNDSVGYLYQLAGGHRRASPMMASPSGGRHPARGRGHGRSLGCGAARDPGAPPRDLRPARAVRRGAPRMKAGALRALPGPVAALAFAGLAAWTHGAESVIG